MDAYLSGNVYLFLEASSLISSTSKIDGLLIGHKRDHRFFVENIFPIQNISFLPLQKYQSLEELFSGKLIGLFSFKSNEKKRKKILNPSLYGKLFLDINSPDHEKMTIKSYVIEYERTFFLLPIQLKLPKKVRK